MLIQTCLFIAKKYDEAGIKPDDIRCFDDIKKIPFLTKQDISDNYQRLLAHDKKRKVKIVHTSGTTGNPRKIVVDNDACAKYGAPAKRGLSWYGIAPFSRYGRIWGMPLGRKGLQYEKLKDYATNCIRLDIFDLSDDALREYYHRCKQLQPNYLYGYTSGIYRFAQFVDRNMGSGKELGLKVVVPTSEVIYDFQRELIENVFNCNVAGEYGAVETGIIAYECPQGGLHVSPEYIHIEIIDITTSAPLGEYGEVVVTSLCNYAMPIIRYRLGDVSALYDETCSCGVHPGFPLLKPVLGRTVDLSRHESIEVYYAMYYAMKNKIKTATIKEWQLIKQDETNYIVKIVKGNGYGPGSESQLRDNIRQALKERTNVQIEYVDQIQRDRSGKTRYFMSEV